MKKLLLIAIALLASSVQAATLTSAAADTAFGRMMSTVVGAGQETIAFSKTGTPLLTQSAATLGADGTAALNVSRTASMLNAGKVAVPLSAVGRLPVASLLPTFAKGLRLTRALTPVGLLALGLELGYDMTADSAGALRITQKSDASVYKVESSLCYVDVTGTLNGVLEACRAKYEQLAHTEWGHPELSIAVASVSVTSSSSSVQFTLQASPGSASWNLAAYRVGDYVEGTRNVAEQEFLDSIAAKSGWPSTSAIADAAADTLKATGDQVQVQPLAVTGPATSPVSTKTVTNADGTKTVTTTTANHTYSGNQVTTVNNTTVNNYDSHDVVTSSSSTTETPAADPSKNACETNPDSLGCSDYGDIPDADELKNAQHDVTVQPVSFPSGGSCPSPVQFSVGFYLNRTYSVSYQPFCDKLALIKPLILALGGLIAAYILADSFKV